MTQVPVLASVVLHCGSALDHAPFREACVMDWMLVHGTMAPTAPPLVITVATKKPSRG